MAIKKTTKRAVKKRQDALSGGAEMPKMMDRRAMEGMMSRISRLLSEQNFESLEETNAFLQQFNGVKDVPAPAGGLTPVEQAQEIMYEAWGAEGERRVALAREALAVSPDCADAYVLLAEETAHSAEEARDLFQKGVDAGERALGAEAFADEEGAFWGMMETRPYMRACEGLAECLLAVGDWRGAMERFQEMLRLNPNDNQGVRYQLAYCYLAENENELLAELLDRYEDDAAAAWLYSRALLKYRQEGASRAANAALKRAFEANPFVPLVLASLEDEPPELPEYVGLGDESEAIYYILHGIKGWLDTPGAFDWFGEQLLATIEEEPPKPSKRKKPRWRRR